MSITKRFVNLVRSNLNSILDKESDWDSGSKRLEDLTDEELEQELKARKRRRQAAQDAADATREDHSSTIDEDAWKEVEDTLRGSRYRSSRQSQKRSYQRSRQSVSGSTTAHLYAQLECPVGADIDTVRKQYRKLMRKYHPDVHSGDAQKQKLATELSQKLTAAYNELRRILS